MMSLMVTLMVWFIELTQLGNTILSCYNDLQSGGGIGNGWL